MCTSSQVLKHKGGGASAPLPDRLHYLCMMMSKHVARVVVLVSNTEAHVHSSRLSTVLVHTVLVHAPVEQ